MVGKSAFWERYVDNQFRLDYQYTMGVDFKIKTVIYKGVRVKMQLWDTNVMFY